MNYRACMVIVALGFTACDTASDPAEKKVGDTAPERATDATKTTSTTNATKPTAPKMTKTASGLEFAILKEGEGSPPPLGSKVKRPYLRLGGGSINDEKGREASAARSRTSRLQGRVRGPRPAEHQSQVRARVVELHRAEIAQLANPRQGQRIVGSVVSKQLRWR